VSDKNLSSRKLIVQMAEVLIEKKLRLAVAESCTGGMLAQQCTSLSGCSDWFECGFVTYSYASKTSLLDVQADVLKEHGAVNKEVAEQMASGVLNHCDANISASITGIAGPSGGSESKPIGTVYIATAVKNQSANATHYLFQGDRQSVREQSVQMSIIEILSRLESFK
jgi:nicotinamide-nucleotide amidase